jgi:peroxiredoxin
VETCTAQGRRVETNPSLAPVGCSLDPIPCGPLLTRLIGRPLPALTLPATTSGEGISVSGLDRAILYCYPGAPYSPEDRYDSPALDDAQHRAFADHWSDFLALNCWVLGVSSQRREEQNVAATALGIGQPLVCDDELRLARELGLPTFSVDNTDWYCRVTLVISDGVILQAFYPVSSAVRSPAQALAWMRRQRWS